jgi:hypothetical protein
MSPSLLAHLQSAERMIRRDISLCRHGYRKTGMTRAQIAYYGARCAWPDALWLVKTNGPGPYSLRYGYPS